MPCLLTSLLMFLIRALGTVHKDAWNHTRLPWNEAGGRMCALTLHLCTCVKALVTSHTWKPEDNMKA